MATPPSLPTIAGIGWPRKIAPKFNTIVADHDSGREVRVPLQTYPLWEFSANYEGVTSSATQWPQLTAQSMQKLLDFFLQMQGQAGVFLYTDPEINAMTNAVPFATGDGSTVAFTFARNLFPAALFFEPVGWVTSVTDVYVNGVLQSGATWSLTTPNTLTFTAAPGAGEPIAADFSYAYQCRFLDDEMDMEEFMANLYELKDMKFRSVKPPPL